MYSTITAASAPMIATVSFFPLNLCSGLLSKTMVVEICRKLPLTKAYKKTNPSFDNTSVLTKYVLSNNPAGAANEKITRCGNAFVFECNCATRTVIKANAAGARCNAIPNKIAFIS